MFCPWPPYGLCLVRVRHKDNLVQFRDKMTTTWCLWVFLGRRLNCLDIRMIGSANIGTLAGSLCRLYVTSQVRPQVPLLAYQLIFCSFNNHHQRLNTYHHTSLDLEVCPCSFANQRHRNASHCICVHHQTQLVIKKCKFLNSCSISKEGAQTKLAVTNFAA